MKTKKGQISLEFLVVLFAMIAILLVFMPVFSKLYKSVLLAVDVYNASNSLQEFKTNVSMLNTLEGGSSFVLELNFVNSVNFSCKDNIVQFIIDGAIRIKSLNIQIALNCDFESGLIKKSSYLITKISTNDLNISLIS